jgi:hypothetical protein
MQQPNYTIILFTFSWSFCRAFSFYGGFHNRNFNRNLYRGLDYRDFNGSVCRSLEDWITRIIYHRRKYLHIFFLRRQQPMVSLSGSLAA